MEQTNFYFETYLGHSVGITKMGSQVYKGKITINDERYDFMYNSSEKQVYLLPAQNKLEDKALEALQIVLYNKGF